MKIYKKKRKQYIATKTNDTQIHFDDSVKYLRMTLNAMLRWRVHAKKKREIKIKYKRISLHFRCVISGKAIQTYNLIRTCMYCMASKCLIVSLNIRP